jgi:hypothetical protein
MSSSVCARGGGRGCHERKAAWAGRMGASGHSWHTATLCALDNFSVWHTSDDCVWLSLVSRVSSVTCPSPWDTTTACSHSPSTVFEGTHACVDSIASSASGDGARQGTLAGGRGRSAGLGQGVLTGGGGGQELGSYKRNAEKSTHHRPSLCEKQTVVLEVLCFLCPSLASRLSPLVPLGAPALSRPGWRPRRCTFGDAGSRYRLSPLPGMLNS